jgi:hypothetical protein
MSPQTVRTDNRAKGSLDGCVPHGVESQHTNAIINCKQQDNTRRNRPSVPTVGQSVGQPASQ